MSLDDWPNIHESIICAVVTGRDAELCSARKYIYIRASTHDNTHLSIAWYKEEGGKKLMGCSIEYT